MLCYMSHPLASTVYSTLNTELLQIGIIIPFFKNF
jgi:hypothetical protein